MPFFRPSPPSSSGAGISEADALALIKATIVSNGGVVITRTREEVQLEVTASGLADLPEAVQDVIGVLASGGSALTMTYNDGANTWVLDVNVDGSTLEVSSDALRLKDAGVTRAKLASALAHDCIQVAVSDLTTALTVGDGAAWWVVPSHLNGLKLKSATIALTVAQSSSGAPQMQMANVTQGWDLLSTRPSIAANKWLDTETGGTAAVVDTASSHDVLTTGDRIRFDIDTAGTGAKGLVATFYVGS